MLPDTERKILRILVNFSALYKRMPTFGEIRNKTGRNKSEIVNVLTALRDGEYIQWQDNKTESIQICKPYEEEVIVKKHWHNN